jgi:hypothetical protein
MDRLAAMDAFIRVVNAGSFSGAANQLRMGQSESQRRSPSWRGDFVCDCCCARLAD